MSNLNAKKAERLTIENLDSEGVKVELGAQYSIKCQYAQIENAVNRSICSFTSDFMRAVRDDGQLSQSDFNYLANRLKEFKRESI